MDLQKRGFLEENLNADALKRVRENGEGVFLFDLSCIYKNDLKRVYFGGNDAVLDVLDHMTACFFETYMEECVLWATPVAELFDAEKRAMVEGSVFCFDMLRALPLILEMHFGMEK